MKTGNFGRWDSKQTIDPLSVVMDMPPLDRFPYKLPDLDPQDPEEAEQAEAEAQEHNLDLERSGQ